MDIHGVEGFGGYRKASELFDLVVEDMRVVRRDSTCIRLVSQQIASADSKGSGSTLDIFYFASDAA